MRHSSLPHPNDIARGSEIPFRGVSPLACLGGAQVRSRIPQTRASTRGEGMSFFCRLSRKHYWCTPHRSADKRLVQVCYECGAERPVAVSRMTSRERFNHSIASARAEAAKLSSPVWSKNRSRHPSVKSASQWGRVARASFCSSSNRALLLNGDSRPRFVRLHVGAATGRNGAALGSNQSFFRRLLDSKLFKPVLKRAKRQPEQLGCPGDVPVGLLHRLSDERPLHFVK